MTIKSRIFPHPVPQSTPGAAGGREWQRDARGFVIDLDGTLLQGGRLTEGAADLVGCTGPEYVIASNNSTHTAGSLAADLKRLGLAIPEERLILAGELTIDLVAKDWPGSRVLPLISPTLRDLAREKGLVPVDRDPEIVVLARDPSFDYEKLSVAANAVRAGVPLIVTNPDMWHPGRGRDVVPETGCLMQAVIACAGKKPYCIVGKPNPPLFSESLRRLGSPADKTVVIGDNPATDIAGAVALGMRYLLIGGDEPVSSATPRDLLAYSGPSFTALADGEDGFVRILKTA